MLGLFSFKIKPEKTKLMVKRYQFWSETELDRPAARKVAGGGGVGRGGVGHCGRGGGEGDKRRGEKGGPAGTG